MLCRLSQFHFFLLIKTSAVTYEVMEPHLATCLSYAIFNHLLYSTFFQNGLAYLLSKQPPAAKNHLWFKTWSESEKMEIGQKSSNFFNRTNFEVQKISFRRFFPVFLFLIFLNDNTLFEKKKLAKTFFKEIKRRNQDCNLWERLHVRCCWGGSSRAGTSSV